MRLEIKVTDLAKTQSYNTLAVNPDGARIYAYTPLLDNDFHALAKYYVNLGNLMLDLDFLVSQVNGNPANDLRINTMSDVINYVSDYCFNNWGSVLRNKLNQTNYTKSKVSISFLQCCITIEFKAQ